MRRFRPTRDRFPASTTQVFQFPAILVPSATVTYTLNSSTVLEGTWGLTQGNQLGNVPMSPVTNRNSVGLGNFPLLYPNNGVVPVGSYQEKVLKDDEGARTTSTAASRWRRATVGQPHRATPPPNNAYPPFLCMQNTNDVALGLTKLWGAHTFKVGYQSQDSMKLQNLGTVTQRRAAVRGARQLRRTTATTRWIPGFGYRERRARRLLQVPAAERAVSRATTSTTTRTSTCRTTGR